jgi:hypothetical protein
MEQPEALVADVRAFFGSLDYQRVSAVTHMYCVLRE